MTVYTTIITDDGTHTRLRGRVLRLEQTEEEERVKLTQECTVRMECRVCGAGFERPTTADGLCLECATQRLTRRQREVLLAYCGHRPGQAPTRIKAYLDAAPDEQQRGARLAGLVRVIRRLFEMSLMDCDEVLVVNTAHLTRYGYRAARRLGTDPVPGEEEK